MPRTRVDHDYFSALLATPTDFHTYISMLQENGRKKRGNTIVVRSGQCTLGRYRLAGTWMPVPLPPTSGVIFILSIQNSLMNMTDHAKILFFETTELYR
jgi:hypothetical protein